jgi:hypothetical protein
MAPKAKDISPADYDKTEDFPLNKDKTIGNNDLIADAGKVKLAPAQPWGRGMCNDVKGTLGTWWVKVSKQTPQSRSNRGVQVYFPS